MSSITFDSKMYNPEIVVSRSENSGGSRKQQHARTDVVDTLPPIAKPDGMQPGVPSKPEPRPELLAGATELSLHSPGTRGEYVLGSDQPEPDPLVLIEIRFFKENTQNLETESRGPGRLDILI